MTARPFVAAPRASFTMTVPEEGLVQLTASLRQGSFEGMELQGPGTCSGSVADVQPGATISFSCGWLDPGTYRISVAVDGAAQGSIRAKGGTFMPEGVGQA